MEKANKKEKLDRYNDRFPTRLRDLMNNPKNPVTRQKLAEVLGLSPQQVSNYTVGTSLPDFNCIYKLATFFGVSADYLLGISDTQSCDIATREISSLTGLTENSIFSLRNESKNLRKFTNTSTPQEALNYVLEKYRGNLMPHFHIINLLLDEVDEFDCAANPNSMPIIDLLGAILGFKNEPQNLENWKKEHYAMCRYYPKTKKPDDIYEKAIIQYTIDHNDMFDMLFVKLQKEIIKYKEKLNKADK